MKPLPSADNTYGVITCEELARDITRNQDIRSEGVAFATCTIDKSSVFCIVCNKSGHLASDCFKIVGSPN